MHPSKDHYGFEEWWIFFSLFVYNFQKKNPPFLKHILALPMVGQICTFEELQPFEIATFDLGHPVQKSWLGF